MEHERAIAKFFEATNAFEVEAAVAQFAPQARINDDSVGRAFEGREGVRQYLSHYFVGYHTKTVVLTTKVASAQQATAHVDFTGDFGHETGGLTFTWNDAGLITAVEAYLD